MLKDLQTTIAEKSIRAIVNARKTLMAGFTTVRDVGSSHFIDVGLRNAINAGIVPGPRMLVAVHALGSTGGHCDDQDSFRYGVFGHESGPEDGVINTPDEARRAVRFNIKYGADVIKTCASGGVLSPTDDVDVPQLTQAELDALVDEAHTLRRKTAAHAHGAEAANGRSARESIPLSMERFWTMRRSDDARSRHLSRAHSDRPRWHRRPPTSTGRYPLSEAAIRKIASVLSWPEQRRQWAHSKQQHGLRTDPIGGDCRATT